jgi:predicted amidohydrolase
VKVGLAQVNTRVGGIDANTEKVLDYAERARAQGCDVVLYPELTLCGYPPEDLLFHRGLRNRVAAALAKVRERVRGIAAYVGYPEYDGDTIYNSAALVRDGALVDVDGIYFTRSAVDDARRVVCDALRERGTVSVGDARDLLQTSRKYAVPLLEHFDREGVTRRRGDTRVAGPNAT